MFRHHLFFDAIGAERAGFTTHENLRLVNRIA